MSVLIGEGLYSLAVILASGYILHDGKWWRHILRSAPPPIPYFRMLAIGLIAWWVVPPALVYGTVFFAWHIPPAYHPQMVFSVALIIRVFADITYHAVCLNPEWKTALIMRQFGMSDFRKLISEAVKRGAFIMLTLRNRKVYIGETFHLDLEASGQENWIRLTPAKSGYRNEATGQLHITTDYESALGLAADGAHQKDGVSMCIPARDVVTFQLFDHELYRAFESVELDNDSASVTSRHS